MKRTVIIIITALALLDTAQLFAFEEISLYNSASRTQYVENAFFGMWQTMTERNMYVDLEGTWYKIDKINVRQFNRGTNSMQESELDLRIEYASAAIVFPFIDLDFMPTAAEDAQPSSTEKPLPFAEYFDKWSSDTLYLGFSMAGYHYGLDRNITIERGSKGSYSAKDSVGVHHYDDIYAASLILKDWFVVHAGIIINDTQILSGRPDFTVVGSENAKRSGFLALNLLNSFNYSTSALRTPAKDSRFSVALKPLLQVTGISNNFYIPHLVAGYRSQTVYSENPSDPVYVDTPYISEGVLKTTANTPQDSATAEFNYYDISCEQSMTLVYYRFNMVLQQCRSDLYYRSNLEPVDVPMVKEASFLAGLCLNPYDRPGIGLFIGYGRSTCWNPAFPGLTGQQGNDTLKGWCFEAGIDILFCGFVFRTYRDYTTSLDILPESYDHVFNEFRFYARY